MVSYLFVYLLITAGCSCLWSLSDIFIPVRNYVAKYVPQPFKKMLLCMECSSFWIGFTIGIFVNPVPGYISFHFNLLNIIVSAICGAIITYLIVKIANKLELF